MNISGVFIMMVMHISPIFFEKRLLPCCWDVDIIGSFRDLLEQELPSSPKSKKTDARSGRKSGKRGKNCSNDKREEEVDDNEKIAEAILIDFDTPTRKLEVESRIFLNKIDIFQIPEIFNKRQIWRFQRLEKISRANLKMRSMDEVFIEEEEEEERRSQTNLKLKPVKRVCFERSPFTTTL